MNCCINCFQSNYVRSIIQKNSALRGKCDFCGKEDSTLYAPEKLVDNFRNLIELYKPITTPPSHIKPLTIEKQILIDFNKKIFTFEDENIVKNLMQSIFKNELSIYQNVFNQPVYLECFLDPKTTSRLNIMQVSWDNFVKEIKTKNRYHVKNTLDLNELKNLLHRVSTSLKKDKIFFRARISDKTGFKKEEMGNPPFNKTKAGRANPYGISYLYLSNDAETTLYETRSLLFDYVTIGEFKLLEDINVINLKETHMYDPIQLSEADGLSEFLTYLPFINSLENELSKPLRRSDNEIDYIPTQYISEFIKSIGYDGIQYKSSLNPNGYNLAIYSPKKFDCVNVSIHEVQEIKFTYKPI